MATLRWRRRWPQAAMWTDEIAPAASRCASRVFLASIEGRLYALDAAAGVPCDGFGKHGIVELRTGVELNGRAVGHDAYTVTSPPAVVGDVVVVGSAVGSTRRRDAPSGIVSHAGVDRGRAAGAGGKLTGTREGASGNPRNRSAG